MDDRDRYLALDEAAHEWDYFVKHGEPYIRWKNVDGKTRLYEGSMMVGEWDEKTGKATRSVL